MKPVNANVSFPELEEQILDFWREAKIFERSIDPELATSVATEKSDRPSYLFYDGPPFATGLPHYGHLLAGTIKDVVGRFFTMKGYHVDRRFGWDCHGVPVEFEIQKRLDLHGAKAIREFGVDKFNEECRKIVLRYTEEWKRFVERSGRWVDFERQYRTMDKDFMESIWWVVSQLWEKGLIYEGVKCVPYSWAINTPLSNFEVNLNYKNVQDPAITARAKLKGDVLSRFSVAEGSSVESSFPAYAYIWTTTPWTLPSNMAMAVGPDIPYSLVANPRDEELAIVASALVKEHFPDIPTAEDGTPKRLNGSAGQDRPAHAVVLAEVLGKELVGLEYEPFFEYFEAERAKNAFRIYAGDFVSAEDGTGIVHCASFGEDDLSVFQAHGISIIDPVDEDGNFSDEVSDFAGQNIKEADPAIIADLKKRGAIVSHKTIEHSYPFCWRTDKPLIYKSISTWFVKVEEFRDRLVANNSQIHWVPEHLRDGRFGQWLANARDWAISRNRFWGTPIPIWRCDACGETHCVSSVSELEERSGESVSDLHSHFVDHLTFACEKCPGTMKRIPEVLDCWFESGSMPYAQAHYPFEGRDVFDQNFPADFIAEGLDQTRGWFYTLLVLSTALFDKPAFKNVIVNGIVLAEDGKKMSKSLKNYPPPDDVMNEFGADAMRLYLLSSAATRAEDLRFSKEGVRHVLRQTLLPLWNAYNFFVTYALVDRWTPENIPQEPSPNLLDRWILSKVASLVEDVDQALSGYHLYAVGQPLLDFVDQLTNWYIRLNRRRFWVGNDAEQLQDKYHAYATLHRALVSFVRVLAPLAPFVSEEIFRNLSSDIEELGYDSVHLAPYPSETELQGMVVDKDLEQAMEHFEEVILLGRSLRNDLGIRTRQPLAELTVIYSNQKSLDNLRFLDAYICDELNVKRVSYSTEEENFVSLQAKLNTKKLGKVLGPKLGADGMKQLHRGIQELSTEQIRAIEQGGCVELAGVSLSADDVLITRATKPGVDAAASSGQITIILDSHITQELELEGRAREFVNRVQKLRKDHNFEVSDRIALRYMTACSKLALALSEHKAYVMEETLAVEMEEIRSEQEFSMAGSSTHLPSALEIEGETVIIGVTRTQS